MKILFVVILFFVFSCKTYDISNKNTSGDIAYLYFSEELAESEVIFFNWAGSYFFSDIFDKNCFNTIGGDWEKNPKVSNEIILMNNIIETYDTLVVGQKHKFLISKKTGLKYYAVKKLPKNQNKKLDSLLLKYVNLDSIFPCIKEVIVNHPPANLLLEKNN